MRMYIIEKMSNQYDFSCGLWVNYITMLLQCVYSNFMYLLSEIILCKLSGRYVFILWSFFFLGYQKLALKLLLFNQCCWHEVQEAKVMVEYRRKIVVECILNNKKFFFKNNFLCWVEWIRECDKSVAWETKWPCIPLIHESRNTEVQWAYCCTNCTRSMSHHHGTLFQCDGGQNAAANGGTTRGAAVGRDSSSGARDRHP